MDWKEIKGKAWDIAKVNKWNVWKVILLVAILEGVLSLIVGKIVPEEWASSIVSLLMLPISVGVIEYMLCLFRGNDFSVSTIFSRYSDYFKILVMLMIYGVCVAVGTLFFIIPGIIIAVTYSFIMYVYLDNPELTIKEIFAATKALMVGNRINYILFGLSFIGWILVVTFTLGIASIWLAPYFQLAQVAYYEALKESKK